MQVIKSASAGSMDSCDIYIRIESLTGDENEVHLNSVVEKQYGEHIRQRIHGLLAKYSMKGVSVNAVDRGALDCTIEARLTCAIHRACETEVSFSEVM